MREIVHCLSHAHPAMFCDNGIVSGPFKPDKLDTIALKLRERVSILLYIRILMLSMCCYKIVFSSVLLQKVSF